MVINRERVAMARVLHSRVINHSIFIVMNFDEIENYVGMQFTERVRGVNGF